MDDVVFESARFRVTENSDGLNVTEIGSGETRYFSRNYGATIRANIALLLQHGVPGEVAVNNYLSQYF